MGGPAALLGRDGWLLVVAHGIDGELWWKRQAPDMVTGWTDWQRVAAAGPPPDLDGSPEVVRGGEVRAPTSSHPTPGTP